MGLKKVRKLFLPSQREEATAGQRKHLHHRHEGLDEEGHAQVHAHAERLAHLQR